MAEPIRWQLLLGDDVVARIVDAHDYDFPWTYGTLVDSPQFERFRSYFADSDSWSDDDPVFDALLGEIQQGGRFQLLDLKSGATHPNVMFNVTGDSVRFRIG